MLLRICLVASVLAALLLAGSTRDVRFVILGDRTGETQPGVYEQVWRETAAEHPDFVINVGDSIQGLNDAVLKTEWDSLHALLRPFARYRFFYTPGNHDVWDDASAAAYVQQTGHPLHYSFDFAQVHISVLDNSRTEDLPESELNWLEHDVATHRDQPVKFVFSHRPSWILFAVLKNPDFRLQTIAKQYGIQYVIAGHLHRMLHADLQGVTYLSMPSAGGHLRDSKRYEDGWFFGHTLVTVHDDTTHFDIKEAQPPIGQGRSSQPEDWGVAGIHMRK